MSAQLALPIPPPTAPVTADDTLTVATPMSTATILASIPALLPIVLPGITPEHEPIPPTTTIRELAEVYLMARAHTSQGIHPTVLEILPDVVGAPEVGTWYVVTVGCYTGIYPEWYLHQEKPFSQNLTLLI